MKQRILRFVRVLFVVLVLYLAIVTTYWLGMYRLDTLVYRIPKHATRTEVRSILKGLHERRVEAARIPPGFGVARTHARAPGATTYSYYLIIPSLEIIIVYDKDGKMVSLVPIYE